MAYRCLGLVLALIFTQTALAQALSARAIYERCYSKLVRLTPEPDDPFVAQIAAGTLSGPNACVQLLRLGLLGANGRINDYSTDPARAKLAKQVIASMHALHTSWFSVKRALTSNTCLDIITPGVTDDQMGALFYTRTLFDKDFPFDSITTSTVTPRAIRSENNPTRSIFFPAMARGAATPLVRGYPDTYPMTASGDLLGIQVNPNPSIGPVSLVRNFPGESPTARTIAAAFPYSTQGGILGSQGFLMNTVGPGVFAAVPNLHVMPRQWAKYVFKDLLCRDLPVIKEVDAAPHRVCTSGCPITSTASEAVLPFRQQNACLQCHVSMDQLGSVVRNFRVGITGSCDQNNLIFSAALTLPSLATLPDTGWGYKIDPEFPRRPATGRFVFRTYNDNLIDTPITSIAQLGSVLAGTDDLYICAAKRYYKYFTGVDADITPMTAAEVAALPADVKYYRTQVVNLGLALKGAGFGKDPLKLVEAIFAKPDYAQKDFSILTKAGGT